MQEFLHQLVDAKKTIIPSFAEFHGYIWLPSGKRLQFANLNMAIEIVDIPIKNGDFPILTFVLPEGHHDGTNVVQDFAPLPAVGADDQRLFSELTNALPETETTGCGGFHQWGYPQKWLVYKGQSH